MKVFYLISFLATLSLSSQTKAQSYVIGNPDSENTFLLQNTTEYINTPQQPYPDWEPLPDSPGVEVAPPPNRVPEYTPQNEIIENNETIIEQPQQIPWTQPD